MTSTVDPAHVPDDVVAPRHGTRGRVLAFPSESAWMIGFKRKGAKAQRRKKAREQNECSL
jgi:hypothetical protein